MNIFSVLLILATLYPIAVFGKRFAKNGRKDGWTVSEDGQFRAKPGPIKFITPGEFRDMHRTGLQMHEVRERYFKHLDALTDPDPPVRAVSTSSKLFRKEGTEAAQESQASATEDGSLVDTSERYLEEAVPHGELVQQQLNHTDGWPWGNKSKCRSSIALKKALDDRNMVYTADGSDDGHAYAACKTDLNTKFSVSCLGDDCQMEWCFIKEGCTMCKNGKKSLFQFGECCKREEPEPTCAKPQASVVTDARSGSCTGETLKAKWREAGYWVSKMSKEDKVTLSCLTDKSMKAEVQCSGCPEGKDWCWKDAAIGSCPPSYQENLDRATMCPEVARKDMERLQFRLADKSAKEGKHLFLTCRDQRSLEYEASCLPSECDGKPWCFVSSSGLFSTTWKEDAKIQPRCIQKRIRVEALDRVMVKAPFKGDLSSFGGLTTSNEELKANWMGTVKEVDTGKDGTITVDFPQQKEVGKIKPELLDNFRKVDPYAAGLGARHFVDDNVFEAANYPPTSPEGRIAYMKEATYREAYRANPVAIKEMLENPNAYKLPKDFKDYCIVASRGLSDWFAVGEVWTNAKSAHFLVVGYNQKDQTTILKPFDAAGNLTEVKGDTGFTHNGNFFTSLKTTKSYIKVALRTAAGQEIYTKEGGNGVYTSGMTPIDAVTQFQLVPSEVPGMLLLVTPQFYYVKLTGDASSEKRFLEIIDPAGGDAKEGGGPVNAYGSGKDKATPFYVVLHEDGTLSLQTMDGYFVSAISTEEETRLATDSSRYNPEAHSFKFSMSLKLSEAADDEADDTSPPSMLKATQVTGQMCVQFDLDLRAVSHGLFPGLFKTALLAEVFKIGPSGCWGWSGSLVIEAQIGWCIRNHCLAAGVHLESTFQVVEMPLSSAAEDLQWQLPYAGYDVTKCLTKDPFDLMRASLDASWEFLRKNFLRNPFRSKYWGDAAVTAAEMARKEEADGAVLEDYVALTKPPLALGGVDDSIQIFQKPAKGAVSIVVQVKPALVRRYPTARIQMQVFEDVGMVDYASENLAPQVIGENLEFMYRIMGSTDKVIHATVLLSVGGDGKFSTSASFKPEVLKDGEKAELLAVKQDAIVDLKSRPADTLSMESLAAEFRATSPEACKGKFVNYVNIAVKSSSNVVKQATWRGDMLITNPQTGRFRHPWGMSLQDVSSSEGIKPRLNIRLLTVEDLTKLVDKGIEADKEKKTCWSDIGTLLCKSLTEYSSMPSAKAVSLFSRNLINQFLLDVFSAEVTRKALATTEQRPALRKSFEHIVSMLPETIMKCAQEAMEMSQDAEAADGDEKGSGQNVATQKALDKIMSCANSKSTQTEMTNRAEVVQRRYRFEWQTLPDKKISGDPTQTCSRLPQELFAQTGSSLADLKQCQKACADEQAMMVEKNRTGTLEEGEGIRFCNTVMFQPLPASDKPGGTCTFYDCQKFNKFDSKTGYSIIARMPVPIEGDESIPVPADVAIASAPSGILADIFRALDGDAVRELMEGMKAYFLSAVKDDLAEQIKVGWETVASTTKGRCTEKSGARPSFEGLSRGEAQGETVLEKIIKSCLFQENKFLTKEVVGQIQSLPQPTAAGESLQIETKVEIAESTLKIKHHRSSDTFVGYVNSSSKNSMWQEVHEYRFPDAGGCSVLVTSTWAWKTNKAKGYMTRPEIVPVAQAFFATWDQFTSKLGPYSNQVMDRLLPQETGFFDFLNKTYESGVGRFLHRQLMEEEQGTVDVAAGDLGQDDGVSNYPTVIRQTKFASEPWFAYNVGLSVANLFIRVVGDIQALFNLYFANHPDWDGQCQSLPSRFHTFYEGPKADPAKWKMHEGSNEDSSRPNFESSDFPSRRTGDTVGQKGLKLSDDDKKLFLDWHWIAGPKRGDYRKKRAAFFKTTAPVHGTDHWTALEPGDVSSVMWPTIWCELVEEQWKIINMKAVQGSVYEHQAQVLEDYYVDEELILSKKHEGLELDIEKVRGWMEEEVLMCEKVFPQGKEKFQLFLKRHNESSGKVLTDFDIVQKWKLVFTDQKKILEHLRRVVLPFLRTQISAFSAKREAECQKGFLKDTLCWVMIDHDVKPALPWRFASDDEWSTRPPIRDMVDQCGNELFGKQEPCNLKDICVSQTTSGAGCRQHNPTLLVVRLPDKGGVDIRSLDQSNPDMRLDKDEVMSKLEKGVDAAEKVADNIQASREKEEAAVANMETLLKIFFEMNKLSSIDHRALSYMNLKQAATAWEVIVASKTDQWTSIMDQLNKLLTKVTKALTDEDQQEAIRLLELLEYAQTYTELSMALQKRQISEYGIHLGCVHDAMRPVHLGHEGMAPYLPANRPTIESQLAALVAKLKGEGMSEVDNVEYYFEAACKVGLETDFSSAASNDLSQPRPECERVVLSKAFVAMMPSLAGRVHQMYEEFLNMLVDLRGGSQSGNPPVEKRPTITQVEAMLAKLKDFVTSIESTLEHDFYQAFAYSKDGTLHGELWRSLAEALSTIRLTLDERKESRRKYITEAVTNKAEFKNKRRLRAQSLSNEAREAMVKDEIIANVQGCACQKAWGVWMKPKGFALPRKHSFEGCRPVMDLNNPGKGKALSFEENWLSWPGICRPKNAFSAVCKAKDWVPCDPNKNPEDSGKFLIWRITDPTRSDWVSLPLFTLGFYASIKFTSSSGSICDPSFGETEFEASFAWSVASWKKYEDEFAHCLTARMSPAGTGFSISRCHHKTTNALLGTESSYVEWKLTGQLYIVSTNNVWGSGNGNYVKSWFGGDHNGKFDDVSTITQQQEMTKTVTETVTYHIYSECNHGPDVDKYGYYTCIGTPDPDKYLYDKDFLESHEETFMQDVAVASPYMFYFGIACKIIMLVQMSSAIGTMMSSDEEEPDHDQGGATKLLMPLAMVVWQGLRQTGVLPADWSIGAAVGSIKDAIASGNYFYTPVQNRMDCILGFQVVWESRSQGRTMTELFEAMEGSQMLTVLNHAKSLGAKMDTYWDEFVNENSMDLSRVSAIAAEKTIADYAYTVENGQLFAGDVKKLQEHLNKMFVGCSGIPGWYKVTSDRHIFPTWERNPESWAKEALPMEGEEFLLASYDSDWFRYIKAGIDEDFFVNKDLSREGEIVSTLTLAEASKRHFIQKPLFQAFLESAPTSTLQCMAYNIEKIKGQEGALAPKKHELPKVAPATLKSPIAADSGYSPAFYAKFFSSKWKAIQGDLKQKGKEGAFLKSFERPGTMISAYPLLHSSVEDVASAAVKKAGDLVHMTGLDSLVGANLSDDKPARLELEAQATNRFFFTSVLSSVNKINFPFSVPGLMNFEYWVGIRNNWDIRLLMNSIMARMNMGKFANTPLKIHKHRIKKCVQCIQNGQAFCDRRSVADSMLRGGHTEEMDKCVPRTKEARHSCRSFMWDINTNILLNSSGPSAFANQVCPCYDRFSGESISPDWVTSVERCEELRWTEQMEGPSRTAGAAEWRDGFAAASLANEQTEYKRTPLKNRYNFDSTFQKRFDEEQELRDKDKAGCAKEFTCCEGMDKGEQRFRCMNTDDLKESQSFKQKLTRYGSLGLAGDVCNSFKLPPGPEWQTAKDAWSCTPKTQTKGFEGMWHMINSKWEKKMTAEDLAI